MLQLPADLEPHTPDGHSWTDAGAYALKLSGPHDPWDAHWDVQPPWWDAAQAASRCIYVGAAQSVVKRLEDHKGGEVRQAALLRVCEPRDVLAVEWDPEPFEATEYNLAQRMRREYGGAYVHSR